MELYELDNDTLKQKCRDWQFDDCTCCLEDVSSSPQMGVKSAFSFGHSSGYIKGVLESHFIPYQLIRPATWKKEFGCNLSKSVPQKDKKAKDVEVCKRLFPTVSLRKTPRCKTDWPDAADAILMAEYARRRL